METIFLDTFDGSGSLNGRTPNVGPSWTSTFAPDAGVVSAGRVGATNTQARNRVYGTFDLPAQAYTAVSFRLRYQVVSGASTYGEVFLGSSSPNPSRNTLLYGGYPYADFFLNNYGGAAFGQGFESSLFYPGENELIQVLDFARSLYQFWVNGTMLLETPADDIGDPNLLAWKNGAQPLNVFLQLSTTKFDSRPLNFYVTEFEIQAEAPSPATVFWTDIVKAAETV